MRRRNPNAWSAQARREVRAQPATVRRQLVRLRAGVVERYQQATGLRLPDDEVVENVGGQGYRLNPTRVLARLA